MSISGWLTHWASWCPEKVAVRFEGREYTYAALNHEVWRVTGALRALGVEPGDRVGYLGANSPVLLEVLFACARLGAILVPFNARMPANELRVFIAHSEPRVVLVEAALLGTARAAAAEAGDVRLVPFGDAGVGDGLDAHLGDAEPDDQPRPLDTPIVMAYTSGTTGEPKGAVLTHGALLFNALNAVTAFGLTSGDEVLTNIPMFHVGGLNILTTPAISVGATVTMHAGFDPVATLREVESRRTTALISVPTMTRALAAHPAWGTTDLASLRCVVTGSTVVTEDDVRPWLDRGIPVCQGYGLTETAPLATVVPVAETRRMGLTAGKPVMYCRVRVVDETAEPVRVGEVGEVLLQGPNVMREYWRNRKATDEAFVEGWFRTGDAGFVDGEGYLHIVGRLKDIIVVGSSNVYPGDVEAVLADCSDIREAAVVGRPDAELGEVPVAFVVLEPARRMSRDMVMALFDGKLASYKHPRDVVLVDALPRTALGKVQKSTLREWAKRLTPVPLTVGSAGALTAPTKPETVVQTRRGHFAASLPPERPPDAGSAPQE